MPDLQEVKVPTLSHKVREGWGTRRLLCGSWGWRLRWSFGGYFGSGDRIDLHRGQDFFQAVEDFVAIDVLHNAVFGSDGGHVDGELVAGPILEDMEILRVALASAFAGDGFGGAQFQVTQNELGAGGRSFRSRSFGRRNWRHCGRGFSG